MTQTLACHLRVQHSTDAHVDEQVRFAHEHHIGETIDIITAPRLEDEGATHYRLELTIAGAVMGILLAVARWSSVNSRISTNSESSVPA